MMSKQLLRLLLLHQVVVRELLRTLRHLVVLLAHALGADRFLQLLLLCLHLLLLIEMVVMTMMMNFHLSADATVVDAVRIELTAMTKQLSLLLPLLLRFDWYQTLLTRTL